MFHFHFDAGTTTSPFTVDWYGLFADLDLMIFQSWTIGHPCASLGRCVGVSLFAGTSAELVTVISAVDAYDESVDGYYRNLWAFRY